MTAEELIILALSLKGESADLVEEYRGYALPALNILLAQTLPLENQLRRIQGGTELEKAPQLSSYADPIDYADVLLRTCLVFGLAASLTAADNDTPRFNYLNAMYHQAYDTIVPGVAEEIHDTVWRNA